MATTIIPKRIVTSAVPIFNQSTKLRLRRIFATFNKMSTTTGSVLIQTEKQQTNLSTETTCSRVSFKSDTDFDYYWNMVLRAEEEAAQKNSHPWIQLQFIPIFDPNQVINTVREESPTRNQFAFGKRKKLDERRSLINPDVRLLHYPIKPYTQPLGIDPIVWKEAFQKSRLFLIGTKHDSNKSSLDINLLMGAVYADFIMLGLSRPLAELILFSTDEELKKPNYGLPYVPRENIENFVHQKLQKEGFDEKTITEVKRKIRRKIDQITLLAQYRKSRVLQSEFRAAQNAIYNTMPTCAGFVLGLETDERLDRLVDLGEEFLMEQILLVADADKKNRVPRFGMDLQIHGLAWTQKLVEWAEYQGSLAFRFKHFPKTPTHLQEEYGRKLNDEFDEFIDSNYPGFRIAMIARQDRQIVRALHTLMHKETIEKLRAAHLQDAEFEPLTIIGIVGHRNFPGICEIWDRPEEVYTGI